MKNVKRIIVCLLILTLLIIVTGVGFTADKELKIIRFSHSSDSTSVRHQSALVFKEIVEKNTDIKVEVYHSSQLAGDTAGIQGVKLGTIQMTVTGAGLYSTIEPKMGITALPFLFETFEEAWAFCDSEVNAKVDKLLLGKGIRVLAYWENGFRILTNSKRPIKSLEDFKGLNIRTPENPIIMATIRALGASASPLPWGEVYMALKQRVFDGQENSIPSAYRNKLWEIQDYLAVTNHVYETTVCTINNDFWETMTVEEQNILTKAAKEAGQVCREMIKEKTEKELDLIIKEGMIVTYPNLVELKNATMIVKEQFEDVFGRDLIEDAYNFIENYRK